MKSKSQMSIEFLLLLIASAAFFSIFYQAYASAQPKAKSLIESKAQGIAFERILSAVKQAEILGAGSKTSVRVTFPSDNNTLSFDNGSSTLILANKAENNTLEETLGFSVVVSNASIGKGTFELEAEYSSKAVKLSVEADSE